MTEENNIDMSNNTNISKTKSGATRIGGVNYNISIQNIEDTANIVVTHTSIICNIITIHKANAKWYINTLSVLLGISMLLFYVSRLIIASLKKILAEKKFSKKIILLYLFWGLLQLLYLSYNLNN